MSRARLLATAAWHWLIVLGFVVLLSLGGCTEGETTAALTSWLVILLVAFVYEGSRARRRR